MVCNCAKYRKDGSRAVRAGTLGLGLLILVPGVVWSQSSAVEVEVAPTTATAPAETATTASVVPAPAAGTSGDVTPAAPESPDAVDAMEAAEKLVAPVAEVPHTTTPEETTSTEDVGPARPIMDEGKKVLVLGTGTGGTTEAKAVASGAEILRMLALVRPKAKEGGRELDTTQTVNLFKDEEEVRRLLGENPTVVYRVVVSGTPLPDPMVIPWMRNAQIVQELLDEAVSDLAEGRVTEATENLRTILADYSDTEQAVKAQEILSRIQLVDETPGPRTNVKVTPTPAPTPTPVPVELNPNVRVSTVLIEPNNPADNRVVIGGRGYAVGEKIRNFPDHKVVSITDDTVMIEVEKEGRTKQFPLPVRSSDSN